MEKEQCSKHKIQAAGERDAGELQCPWLIHAAYFCMLIWAGITQLLLGSWSALSEEGAFDACQSETAAQELPRHGWATEHEMRVV